MSTSNTQEKTFLASLFDFGFTSFVTLRFLKVIYTIFVVLILLGGVFALIAGLSTGSAIGIIGAIIFAPLITLVYLVVTRIAFEVIAMFFRIGDNTALTVQLLRGGNPGQWNPGPQPGFGPPPQYGGQAYPSAPSTSWNPGQGGSDPATGPTSSSPQSGQQGNYGQQDQSPDAPPSSGSQGWGSNPPPKQ